jgi:hypothetical protein
MYSDSLEDRFNVHFTDVINGRGGFTSSWHIEPKDSHSLWEAIGPMQVFGVTLTFASESDLEKQATILVSEGGVSTILEQGDNPLSVRENSQVSEFFARQVANTSLRSISVERLVSKDAVVHFLERAPEFDLLNSGVESQ